MSRGLVTSKLKNFRGNGQEHGAGGQTKLFSNPDCAALRSETWEVVSTLKGLRREPEGMWRCGPHSATTSRPDPARVREAGLCWACVAHEERTQGRRERGRGAGRRDRPSPQRKRCPARSCLPRPPTPCPLEKRCGTLFSLLLSELTVMLLCVSGQLCLR